MLFFSLGTNFSAGFIGYKLFIKTLTNADYFITNEFIK